MGLERQSAVTFPFKRFSEYINRPPKSDSVLKHSSERRDYINKLNFYGFDNENKKWITDRIVDIGLPVDNYRSIHRKVNSRGTERHLGSWGIGSSNYGEFSVYELLDKQIKEKQLGTIIHEGAHANTPFDANNSKFYGSETNRLKVVDRVREITQQTIITRKFIDGYHKYLYEKYNDGQIRLKDFQEETWAIMCAHAITNRQKLNQVEQAQHLSLDKLRGEGVKVPKKVNLLTHKFGSKKGGVDQALIHLIKEVSSYDQLIQHTIYLKRRFYPDDSFQIVLGRLNHAQHWIKSRFDNSIQKANFVKKKILKSLTISH